MKNLLTLILFLCLCSVLHAQVNNLYLYGDTVSIEKKTGTAELRVKNSTASVPGFLFNTGLGNTKFKLAVDSIYFSSDTIHWRMGNNWYASVVGGSSTDGFVPYVGANANLFMGSHVITAAQLNADNYLHVGNSTTPGTLYLHSSWENDKYAAITFNSNGANVAQMVPNANGYFAFKVAGVAADANGNINKDSLSAALGGSTLQAAYDNSAAVVPFGYPQIDATVKGFKVTETDRAIVFGGTNTTTGVNSSIYVNSNGMNDQVGMVVQATQLLLKQDSLYYTTSAGNHAGYALIDKYGTGYYTPQPVAASTSSGSTMDYFVVDTTIIADGHTFDFSVHRDSVHHFNQANQLANFDSAFYNGSNIIYRFHAAPDSLAPVHIKFWWQKGIPVTGTNFGVLNSQPGQYSAAAFTASQTMGFKTYRVQDVLDDGVSISNISNTIAAGFTGVVVNVNMHASNAANPKPWMSMDSLVTLSTQFFDLLDASGLKPYIVCINLDNEEDTNADPANGDSLGYHTGPIAQVLADYRNLLTAFYNIGHARGYRISNAGINSVGNYMLMAYWYQLHGEQAKFNALRNAFMPGLTADTLTGRYRERALVLYDHVTKLKGIVDLLNLHYYGFNSPSLPAFIWQDAQTLAANLCNVPAMTNETGSFNTNTTELAWEFNGTKSAGFPIAVFYGGRTPDPAQEFNDASGVLNTRGLALKTYLSN